MASLSGNTIATTYDQLLSLPDGGLAGTTLVAITDGDSSNTIPLQVATDKLLITDDAKLYFGTGSDAYIEYDEDGTNTWDFSPPAGGMKILGSTAGLIVGVDDTGADVRFYSATASEGLLYDASEDELGLLLTTKLKFHDIGGGEEIYASGDGALVMNSGTSLTVTTPDMTLTSATASKPILHITNTHDLTTSGELRFNKDSTGDDNDIMGLISFYGTDSSDNTHERLAYMDAIITDSAHGSEAASLRFYVAENDATLTQGLSIAGQADDNGEVDVTIGAGAASTCTIAGLLTVTGGGITFPATQVASADANTLDDYEEGTWTPVLSDGSNNATAATAVGTYTKIGNLVTLRWLYTCSALESVSGVTRFTGLPFTPKNTANNQGVFMAGVAGGLGTGGGENIGGHCNPNEAYILLHVWASSLGSQGLPHGNISDDGSFTMFGQYHT